MSDTALDRKSHRLIELPGPTSGLEAGLARDVYDDSGKVKGRYRCEACRQDLILRAVKPTAKQQPHFRHQNSQECPATPERRRQIDEDLQVVINLRDQIVRAWPGVPVTIEQPEASDGTETPGPGRAASDGMPPAVVVCGPGETVVVERPRALPGPEQVRQRIRAVRARFGAGARHVWFLAKEPLQFARCGHLEVKPRGGEKVYHLTIAPTEQQLAIIAAGGGVYFLDGQQVLVPYGVHDFTHATCHEACDGEAWDFNDWRRNKNWQRDWRISHPVPDPDATRWGLVPTSLNLITGAKATFDLAEAHARMQRLADVQKARWRRRHADARELYSARHAPPPPAIPILTPAPVDQATGPLEPEPTEQPSVEPGFADLPVAPPGPDTMPPQPIDGPRTGQPARPEATAVPRLPSPRDAEPEQPVWPPARSVVPAPPAYPPSVPTASAPAVPEPRQRSLRRVLRRFFGGQ